MTPPIPFLFSGVFSEGLPTGEWGTPPAPRRRAPSPDAPVPPPSARTSAEGGGAAAAGRVVRRRGGGAGAGRPGRGWGSLGLPPPLGVGVAAHRAPWSSMLAPPDRARAVPRLRPGLVVARCVLVVQMPRCVPSDEEREGGIRSSAPGAALDLPPVPRGSAGECPEDLRQTAGRRGKGLRDRRPRTDWRTRRLASNRAEELPPAHQPQPEGRGNGDGGGGGSPNPVTVGRPGSDVPTLLPSRLQAKQPEGRRRADERRCKVLM